MATGDTRRVAYKDEIKDEALNATVTYSTPTTYSPPASGDSVKTLFGKITKGLADLFSGKIDKAQIINNLAATVTGNVLDATQGKALDDKITTINANLATTNTNLANKAVSNNLAGTAPTNLLLIGGDYNKRTYLNASNYTNSPVAGFVVGVRNVYEISTSHYLVEIKECYPVAGRIWNNFYNVSAWTGWKSTTPV
jgi:hypothetical protein